VTFNDNVTATTTVDVASGGTIDGPGPINVPTLTLTANSGIGTGTLLNLTNVSSITADTTAGDIDISHTTSGPVTVQSMTTGGGNIDYNQTNGNLLIANNAINASGSVTLTVGGSVEDAATDSNVVNITANTLTITAGGSINPTSLETIVSDINLDVVGNIRLRNLTGNLNISGLIAGGFLELVNSGDITQTGAIDVGDTSSFDANNITLTNTGNDFSGRVIIIDGNNVTLTDTNTLLLDWVDINGNFIANAVTTSLSPVPDATRTTDFNVGGDIDFSSNGTLNIARDTVLFSGTNNIDLTGTEVTGDAALQILTPLLANLTLSNGSGVDLLDARVFSNFTGHLVIGGTIEAPTRPALSDGTEVVTINTDLLTIAANVNLSSSSDITLLGSNISLDINAIISAGGVGGNGVQNALDNDQVSLIAVGNANGGVSGPGDITGISFPGTVEGAAILLVAANDIINANNLIIDANGGNLQTVVGSGNTPTFGVLNATPIDSSDATISFLNGLAVGTGLNLNNLTFVQAQTLILGNLIGLEQIAFIDTGLFEEDLTLYGTIGQGIALSLAQCEEIEGCAPDVTETELDELIEGLEARIDEMERRLEEDPGRDQEQLERLLAGYEQELENFNNYKTELQQFYEADEVFDDEFGEDFATGEIRRLNTILDTVTARIDWLENLKANTDLRAQLSENTGVELTIEAIDEIIRATQQQIRFIERQIQQLLDGTQASLGSGFVAEVGDLTLSRFPRYENELYSYNQHMKQIENSWY
jgi:hypothetical protein